MGRETIIQSAGDKPPNPIYEHFTRGSGWPNLRQSRWLAVGLVLACTAVMVWLLSPTNYQRLLSGLILFSGIVVFSPVALSVYGTNLAHRLIKSIDYQMIRLTPLSEVDVLEGISLSALFRLRVLRAISTGLAPIVGLLLLGRLNFQPDYVGHILIAIIGVGYAVVIWLTQWVTISLGIDLGLRNNSPWRAMFLTMWMAVIMSGGLYFVGQQLISLILVVFSMFILEF